MPRGGSRPGAGRPRKGGEAIKPDALKREAKSAGKTPLEYMLSVMNDTQADEARRDRMAQAAAPYVHGKAADAPQGKKAERQQKASEVASRFRGVGPPPLRSVN